MSPASSAPQGAAQSAATAPAATGSSAADAPVLVRRLRGESVDPAAPPSVWFMRQAGRSLPEYRAAREGTGMLEACLTPDLAAEITVQPVRRHRVDAGIFFSDIVVPARIAGLEVEIVPGRGPVFAHPIRTRADIDALPPIGDHTEEALEPIREAVRLTTAELGPTPLIGFCGAPFTVASYMVEGGPSRDHLRTRALIREDPEAWDRLAGWVAELSGRFLRAQVLAGAQAVQLFDSWVGALSAETYLAHVQHHSAAVLGAVADLPVPRIHFGVGASHLLREMHAAGATTMGVDHRIGLDQAIDILGGDVPVQGNIDPAVLFTGAEAREAEARTVLARGAAAPGHVVNLGHGVPPDTDPGVLTDLVAFLHEQTPGDPASTTTTSTPDAREADAL
ncbi:uroporphyrinogen decarboxylase [Brachybacterium endophyticum]|uniref:Uroporphyrinogen decarboxylase n=1 Tax=Brachybacterium endophyticum TaxID=2182385 RepID=A0A2U2RKU4_9MICO|nr:uroporphyrinogen decarboxylase [Brachybacterium endophyticum]PWH06415.1 uroporphyrinogen decarboxylase [Brachybacterium endophyticum]